MASKKKGLSLEEKRQRMLDLFFEKKEFFQLKELERIAPKEKGVVSQSVKEVVQMLVDDGLVDCEKIGTFVCYWAFPSKALQTRKKRLDCVNGQLADVQRRLDAVGDQLQSAAQGKQVTEERTELLSGLKELRDREKKARIELDKYGECDPAVIAKMTADGETAKEAANRWTDNIDVIKKWCRHKFGLEETVMNKQFGIPEDLDYVD